MVFRNLCHTVDNDLIKEELEYHGYTTQNQVVISIVDKN